MDGSSDDNVKRYSTVDQDINRTVDNLFKTDNDWNSLYLKHKGAVKNRIGKEFRKYTSGSHKRRCMDFAEKVSLINISIGIYKMSLCKL